MDNLENVEDLTFLWNFDETESDLRMQLLRVTKELEQARREKIEKEKLNMENVKKLIYLLEFAYKERDELKHQLRTLSMVKGYNKPCACSLPTTTTTNTYTSLPNKQEQTNIGSVVGQVQTDSNACNLTSNPSITLPTNQGFVIGQVQTNSNICNLTSNPPITLPTHQQQFGTNHLNPNNTTNFPTMSSQSPLMMVNNNANLSANKVNSSMTTSSSSMDSFFDVGSSSDVSYLGNPDNLMKCTNSSYDASVLDNLAQGKTKPEKGKLLQSVIEAGPTLDSLLVAGPLPEWSNPPQLAYDPQLLPPVPVSMSKRPQHHETLEY
uniref:Uncharacterized protein n=1 Tax=Chenopodium quinoa TaxID=63459 RepID=A0A803LCP1_CHEQI